MESHSSPSCGWSGSRRPCATPLAYAFRTWVAGILALYIAFFCQLESPYWAPIATWIACLPIPGMTGTPRASTELSAPSLGAFIGVVLIALFAQKPELFILALALWVGACTLFANLMRNFRAYASVLAGYTTAIVALPTIPNPNQIFDVAMARGSCTIIGILCAIVVTRPFRPAPGEGTGPPQAQGRASSTRRCRAAFPLAGIPGESRFMPSRTNCWRTSSISIPRSNTPPPSPPPSASTPTVPAINWLSASATISAARAIRAMEDEGGPVVLPDTLAQMRNDVVACFGDIAEAVAKEQLPQSS